jgi:hypothetical protein
VVAPHHPEVSRCMRELALFDLLYPSTKDTHRHLVFLFARDRTGVTANAAVLIDDKTVSHLWTSALVLSQKRFQASTS